MNSDSLSRAILNSVQTRIAVVDEQGIILMVNDAWSRAAREGGDADESHTGIGVNYIDITRRSAEAGDTSAIKALAGMEKVLKGERNIYELRYPCHSPTEEHWYLMRVTPLKSDVPRGVVVSHIDITVQHLASRARARRAQRQQDRRRQAREMSAIQSVADNIDAAPPGLPTDDLIGRYERLLEQVVEARAFRIQFDRAAETQTIAAIFGRQSAGPRDVIRLHTEVLERIQGQLPPSQKLQVYLEESRLLLIEVMGYLATYYRDIVMRDLEQRGL
jgi:hypothetical protein